MISTILALVVALIPFIAPSEVIPEANALAPAESSLSNGTFQLHGQPEVTLTVRSTVTPGEFTWRIEFKGEVQESGELKHIHGLYYKMTAGDSVGVLVLTEYGCSTVLVAGENPGNVSHWVRT